MEVAAEEVDPTDDQELRQMQTKINPYGQDAHPPEGAEPVLWPRDRERIETALSAALASSLTQSLGDYERKPKVIELATMAVHNALASYTHSGG